MYGCRHCGVETSPSSFVITLPCPSSLMQSVSVGTLVTMNSCGLVGSIGTQILPKESSIQLTCLWMHTPRSFQQMIDASRNISVKSGVQVSKNKCFLAQFVRIIFAHLVFLLCLLVFCRPNIPHLLTCQILVPSRCNDVSCSRVKII